MDVPRSQMNIYLAPPHPGGGLLAVLPDGGLKRSEKHDAVLALDPYPKANFGHLVILFYVDLAVDQAWCKTRRGLQLSKCLSMS